MYHLCVVAVILVLFAIALTSSNKKKQRRPALGGCSSRAAVEIAPVIEAERSLVELETDCPCSDGVGRNKKPDIVRNMWKSVQSLPDVDSVGQYVTSWNRDLETQSWNRYNIDRAGGLLGYVNSISPSKNII